jgi:hypothetical protein
MTGFIKLMSNENLDDADHNKGFQLISLGDGSRVEFKKNAGGFDAVVVHNPQHSDAEEILLVGNAYVLSNAGKTIASHSTNVTSVGEVNVLGNDALTNQLSLLSTTDLIDVFEKTIIISDQNDGKFRRALTIVLSNLK